MKKPLVVAALAILYAASAHAQSSVTLYGLIDAGFTWTGNLQGHNSVLKASTGNVGSKWGLLGTEDLGGGLKAIFKLEDGFNVFNGMIQTGANRIFGREAWAGLSSSQYGGLTFGRQYDSVVDYLGPLALTGTAYGAPPAAHPFDNDNLDNSFRVNNSVKYQSINYGGFKFSGLYAFSNEAGGFSDNRAYSFGTSYDYGPLHVAGGYLQLNSNVNAAAANAAGAVSLDTVLIAARQRVFGAGLSYAFGSVTASFVFTQTKLTDPVGIASGFTGLAQNTPLNGDVRFDNYEANVRWILTPTISLVGGYTYTDSRLDGRDPKWQQVNLQAAYSFSKRTDVFLQGAYQHVSNLGGTGVGAFISSVGMSSTGNQGYAALGMRVRF